MKSLFASALLCLSAVAVHAAPVMINFDEQAAGTSITNQYAALGVNFTQASISDFTCCGTPTPTLVNAEFGGGGGDTRYSSLSMAFSTAMSAVGFDFNYYGTTSGAVALAYGAGGALLETLNITTVGSSTLEPVAFSVNGIESVEVRTFGYPSAGWLFAIDNLQFETGNSVPVPGSLALLGIGLVAVRATRRRA